MKVLSILNEKGGVGKSFIATQFALILTSKETPETFFRLPGSASLPRCLVERL